MKAVLPPTARAEAAEIPGVRVESNELEATNTRALNRWLVPAPLHKVWPVITEAGHGCVGRPELWPTNHPDRMPLRHIDLHPRSLVPLLVHELIAFAILTTMARIDDHVAVVLVVDVALIQDYGFCPVPAAPHAPVDLSVHLGITKGCLVCKLRADRNTRDLAEHHCSPQADRAVPPGAIGD